MPTGNTFRGLFLLLFLPVMVLMLIAGVINLIAFYSLYDDSEKFTALVGKEHRQLTVLNSFLIQFEQEHREILANLRDEAESNVGISTFLAEKAERVEQLDTTVSSIENVHLVLPPDVVLDTQAYHQALNDLFETLAVSTLENQQLHIDSSIIRLSALFHSLNLNTHEFIKDLTQHIDGHHRAQLVTLEQHAAFILIIGGIFVALILTLSAMGIRWFSDRLVMLTQVLETLTAGKADSIGILRLQQKLPDRFGFERMRRVAVTLNRLIEDQKALREDSEKAYRQLGILYELAKLIDDKEPRFEELCQVAAERIPDVMAIPSLARVQISPDADMHCNHTEAVDGIHHVHIELNVSPTQILCVRYTDVRHTIQRQELEILEIIAARLQQYAKKLQAQQIQDKNRQLLKAVIDEAPDAIELVEADTLQIVEVNKMSCELTGYSRDELLQMVITDIMPEETRAQLPQKLEPLGSTGRLDFENRHLTKTGKVLNVSVHLRALNINGIDYYLGLWRDISAEKQAQEQLEMLQMAVEQSPDPVIITDLDANITYVNEAFEEKTGYGRDEVIGQNPRILSSGKTPRKTYDEMWAQLTAGRPWQGEFINLNKQGEERIEKANITPLKDELGAVKNYVAVKEDITDSKRMRAELEDYKRNLENLVEQRTAELSIAKDAAEAANRSKSQFLANMSHEIRTPMNAIIGLTHMLRRKIDDERQLEQLSKIDLSANHLLGIINDILDLSKIEANRIEFESVKFELEPILDNVMAMVRDRAEEKGLELVVKLDSVPNSLIGDGMRLGQILLNLVGNAVKFTEAGFVELSIVVVSSTNNEVTLRFEVTDSGIGLTKKQQERLFQPFEQADSSTSRQYGGTGLGLAICRRLVNIMGGKIGVISQPDEGSTFWFELKLTRSDVSLSSPAHDIFRDKRLLLVDDFTRSSRAESQLLEQLGFEVEIMADKSAALERLAQGSNSKPHFDILLLAQHKYANGACSRHLSKIPAENRPLCVLISDGLYDVSSEVAPVGLFTGVLQRPLLPQKVSKLIYSLLSGERLETRDKKRGETERILRNQAQGRRILLAEDNQINQEVAMDLLTDVGFDVEVAENGQVAVDIAREASKQGNQHDLVLMDMQMPLMDGIEATRLIRRLSGWHQVPILAMTANVFEQDQRACRDAGMNDHIGKPVDPEQLFTVLSRWLPMPENMSDSGLPDKTENAGLSGDINLTKLPLLEGIDIDEGLRHALGKMTLYRRLLVNFVESEEGGNLLEAANSEDWASVLRASHTIKSMAATIGASDLSSEAAELESILKNDESGDISLFEDMVARLAQRFEAMQQQIRATLKLDDGQTQATELEDNVEWEDVLSRIKSLLASDDVSALELYQSHTAMFSAHLGKQATEFRQKMEGFAFDEALAMLKNKLLDR